MHPQTFTPDVATSKTRQEMRNVAAIVMMTLPRTPRRAVQKIVYLITALHVPLMRNHETTTPHAHAISAWHAARSPCPRHVCRPPPAPRPPLNAITPAT